jgi:hypothetical protein
MTTIFVDLVLDNGELIRIECPSKFEDQLYDTIENAMKIRDWWSPNQFGGCTAAYLGLSLDRVNMARVIGTL